MSALGGGKTPKSGKISNHAAAPDPDSVHFEHFLKIAAAASLVSLTPKSGKNRKSSIGYQKRPADVLSSALDELQDRLIFSDFHLFQLDVVGDIVCAG